MRPAPAVAIYASFALCVLLAVLRLLTVSVRVSENASTPWHDAVSPWDDESGTLNRSVSLPVVAAYNRSSVLNDLSGVRANATSEAFIRAPELRSHRRTAVEFERQDGVVVVTKIHGSNHVDAVVQTFCLFMHAYNHRVLYDFVVFATLPLTAEETQRVRDAAAPANVTVVVDNPGLHELIRSFDEEQQRHLLQRCNVTSVEELEWYTYCEEQQIYERLAYTWQCEFRTKHLWTHPVLQSYRTMLWLDTDAFCTQTWDRDPVSVFRNNNLVILFDNFPAGSSRTVDFPPRYRRGLNVSLCSIQLKTGHLVAIQGGCPKPAIQQIHGFFHITDLEFFRSPPVQRWLNALIGDSKFSRLFDDQIAVTVPAAVLAPNRSWDMYSHGLQFKVYHNFLVDGKTKQRPPRFTRWWKESGKNFIPQATCNITVDS